MASENETVTAKVPPEMRREIRVQAAKADMSMSEWIRRAIDERLDEDGAAVDAPADD